VAAHEAVNAFGIHHSHHSDVLGPLDIEISGAVDHLRQQAPVLGAGQRAAKELEISRNQALSALGDAFAQPLVEAAREDLSVGRHVGPAAHAREPELPLPHGAHSPDVPERRGDHRAAPGGRLA
jgi:hypothetical protein